MINVLNKLNGLSGILLSKDIECFIIPEQGIEFLQVLDQQDW